MRENIEKSIKRWLKRKVTITLGMMVAFMINRGDKLFRNYYKI